MALDARGGCRLVTGSISQTRAILAKAIIQIVEVVGGISPESQEMLLGIVTRKGEAVNVENLIGMSMMGRATEQRLTRMAIRFLMMRRIHLEKMEHQ
jgi:hypothetical protein